MFSIQFAGTCIRDANNKSSSLLTVTQGIQSVCCLTYKDNKQFFF